MSRENVEVVRRIYESRTRDDGVWLTLVDRQFVMDYSRRLVDPFVMRVLDDPSGAEKHKRELFEAFEGPPVMEPVELIDVGDNVLAVLRISARGRTSGAATEVKVAHVITFRDGRPVQDVYYGEDRAAALEAERPPRSGESRDT